MKKTIKAFSLILTMCISIFLFTSCGVGAFKSSSPGDVVKDMVGYIIDDDLDGFMAISDNNGKEFSEKDRETSKAIMGFVKEDIEKKGGLKEIIIIEEVISEDGLTASVKMQLVYNNGKKAPKGDAKLVKVDGVWKIKSL